MIDDDDDDDEDDEDDDDVSAVGLYQHKIDLDLEWKTQSLPSLGRVSSLKSASVIDRLRSSLTTSSGCPFTRKDSLLINPFSR